VPPPLAIGVAVLAISTSGPLVRFASAPAISIAAWRLLISVGIVAVVLALRGKRGRGWAGLGRTDAFLALLAGVFLAGHFWAFFASLRLTSVASAVVLVSMQPIFVGLLSAAFIDERPSPRQWLGIVVAVGGAAVIGGGDLSLRGDALLGDALALLGAALGAAYFVLGRRLRAFLDLWEYVAVVYGAAAVVLLSVVLLTPSAPMTGFAAADWWVFAALAVGPMMLGHTGLNYAIRYVPAYVANLALLAEPVGATLLAWLIPAIAERPPANALVGGAIVLCGIALGLMPRRK